MFLFKNTTNTSVMTGYYEGISKCRARGQTMNTVGAEASIGSG